MVCFRYKIVNTLHKGNNKDNNNNNNNNKGENITVERREIKFKSGSYTPVPKPKAVFVTSQFYDKQVEFCAAIFVSCNICKPLA